MSEKIQPENDSVYFYQFYSIYSQVQREKYGLNILDLMEMKKELHDKAQAFRNGKLPSNEAADIARVTLSKSIDIEIKLAKDIEERRKELKKYLEEHKSDDYTEQGDPELRCLISLRENLKQYREMALAFAKLIQNSVYDSEYWNMRMLSPDAPLKGGIACSVANENGETRRAPEDNHALMLLLKIDYPNAYTAIKNGIKAGLIVFNNNCFNFKCDKGCVGLIFSEAGCTEYKQIARFILINGEKPAENTLRNCKKNTPPSEWERIKPIFFPTTPKQPQNSAQ